jgi:hypothetical protein
VPEYEKQLTETRWVHSSEEDTDDEMVFRPADSPLPPARGRTSLEFRADGTYVEGTPGPVDVPEAATGSWSLDGARLVLEAEGSEPNRALEITGAEPDRLTIKK